jgi:uncharacterized protein YycO
MMISPSDNSQSPMGREIMASMRCGREHCPADIDDRSPGGSPRDTFPSAPGDEALPSMPVNLRFPKKKLFAGIPAMRVLAAAMALQVATKIGSPHSVQALGDDGHKGLTPEQVAIIKETLQPGDIILSRTPTNQLYYMLQKAAFGSDFSHAAMYAGNNQVIDAYQQVKASTVEDFCAEQGAVLILRPPYNSEQDSSKALGYLNEQLGKPYDWRFDLKDESAHYCTEIIIRALEKSNPELEIQGRWCLGRPVVVPDDLRGAGALQHIAEFRAS